MYVCRKAKRKKKAIYACFNVCLFTSSWKRKWKEEKKSSFWRHSNNPKMFISGNRKSTIVSNVYLSV